jgi:DNA repair protein SbcD/Mre11
MESLNILLIADTHLGFDHTYAPRVERRRRGPDFFRCFKAALEPALRGEVDVVVHSGDLFYRSKIPERLVWDSFQMLFEVAGKETPVYLVPGNHERGAIPHGLLALHRNVHIFDRPRTFIWERDELRVALAGFPCVRNGIRDAFRNTLAETGWDSPPADLRLLCLHQTVEGARVHNYTFRNGPDVIPMTALPNRFRAVLSGHIHRSQILTSDLRGRISPAPVYYPGSVERTAFVERFEEKGAWILTIPRDPHREIAAQFIPLPARPMVVLEIDPDLEESEFRRQILELDPDAVAQVRLTGPGFPEYLRASVLREWAPPSLNLEIIPLKKSPCP